MADQNKIQYGFKNVYYSIITEADGEITFGTPKPWKGARSLTLSAEGETSNYYADDMVYFSTSSNAGYTGTLTMAKMSDDVLKDIYGYPYLILQVLKSGYFLKVSRI
jgi:phi13 family phage major tail protein